MRSGTSLTRVLLSQHPDVFGTFETHWYTDALRLSWHDPTSRRMELLRSLLAVDDREYARLCDEKKRDPEREFIDIVMEYCAQRAGKHRWVEKTPGNIRFWSLIRAQWPDAYLIHVTREYKDVFASWKTKRHESLDSFLSAARTAYDDIEHLLGGDVGRYLEVDYSELVVDTESTLRRILQRIAVPWDRRCAEIDLAGTNKERERVRDVLGRESPTAESLTKPIFQSGIGQWKNILTAEEARTIETELSHYYDVFGDRWSGQRP